METGALGLLDVSPGWYVYIGSAFDPGGVRARCLRHWRGGRPHWHIDYLRPLCRMQTVWFTHDPSAQGTPDVSRARAGVALGSF